MQEMLGKEKLTLSCHKRKTQKGKKIGKYQSPKTPGEGKGEGRKPKTKETKPREPGAKYGRMRLTA